MVPAEIDKRMLHRLLDAVGAHLESDGETASIIVVGGAALSLRGWVERTTHDVDVIATTGKDGQRWTRPRFSPSFIRATARVTRDFHVEENWLNAEIGPQWDFGLPDGVEQDVQWLEFRALRVGVVGRQTMVTLKLYAAVDQWPRSVHLQDLYVLSPTDEELDQARRWVEQQDINPDFPSMVAEVIENVASHR